MDAWSSGFPTRFRGCRSDDELTLLSEFNNLSARGVSVSDGATALTRIVGDISDASAFVNPSIAPLAAEMLA